MDHASHVSGELQSRRQLGGELVHVYPDLCLFTVRRRARGRPRLSALPESAALAAAPERPRLGARARFAPPRGKTAHRPGGAELLGARRGPMEPYAPRPDSAMATTAPSRLRRLTLDVLDTYTRVGAGRPAGASGAGGADPARFAEWIRLSTTPRAPGRPSVVPRRSLTAPNVGGGNEGRDNVRTLGVPFLHKNPSGPSFL